MQLMNTCYFLLVVASVVAHSEEEPFKINKLNLVWMKAQHSLGLNKLKDLRNDLSNHEADELNLKRMKAQHQDKDGLFEATVRKRLLSIMKKYSLDVYFDDSFNKQSRQDHGSEPETVINAAVFRDSKLDKLWKKAEKAGFDQEQLMILHEEFQHQQEKLDEHYETLSIIEDEINKNVAKSKRAENALDELDHEEVQKKKSNDGWKRKKTGDADGKKFRFEENIYQDLRDKYNILKRGYDELAGKIGSVALDEDKPFQEEKVNELWSIALKSNFSMAELESLKQELSHYQTRIQKLKHFAGQLERDKIASKEYMNYAEKDGEYKHIKKKVRELTEKVKKADLSIRKKISKEEL